MAITLAFQANDTGSIPVTCSIQIRSPIGWRFLNSVNGRERNPQGSMVPRSEGRGNVYIHMTERRRLPNNHAVIGYSRHLLQTFLMWS